MIAKGGEVGMGLTERHFFEDEEPELTENQLEDVLLERDKAYKKGYADAMKNAVPLDKLCEWLAGNAWHLDCSDCDGEHCYCPQLYDDSGSSSAFWKAKLTKWMEEQDASN